MRFANKAVIVTGGGRGIGKATALKFAREGADVLIPDLDPNTAARTAAEIQGLGRKGISMQMDVARIKDIQRMVETAMGEFGKIDVLINNAGISGIHDLLEITESNWDRTLDVNLKGVFFCLQLVAREMIKRRSGVILNAASIGGRIGRPYFPDYCASKFAVIAITQAAAQALGPHGIRVNAVAPGVVDTDMWTQLDRDWGKLMKKPQGELTRTRLATLPLGRIETADDVAKLYAFLASDEASYITGQTYNVCGGLFFN